MVKPARAGSVVVTRGDVWLAALDPTVGSEIRKTRPCIVVSPPEMHDYLRTVIVAPMTTGNRPAPFRIPVSFAGKNGLILLVQMRTLDKHGSCSASEWLNAAPCEPRSRACATCSQINRSIRISLS